MLVSAFSIALMLAGAPIAPAAVTQTQSQDQSTALPTVEVEGQRRSTSAAARSFTNEILATPPRRGIARWRTGICPGVLNLQRDVAQALIDRVSDQVADLGLEVGEPGCEPNVLIVGADDGKAMAAEMVGSERSAFITGVAGTSLTFRALNVFRTSDAPVRWWLLTLPLDSDTLELTVRTRGADQAAVRNVHRPSRLRTQDINAIWRNLVIVDVNQIGTVDVGQLGDYIAMVSLAQVDAEADLSGFDTVLNLFDEPASVTGLTDWDRRYLRELYSAELSALRMSHQVGAIAGGMAREDGDED